jgi:hypothetical protein
MPSNALKPDVNGVIGRVYQVLLGIALVAAKHGLRVEFSDRNLQQVYELALQTRQRGLERGGREIGEFGRWNRKRNGTATCLPRWTVVWSVCAMTGTGIRDGKFLKVIYQVTPPDRSMPRTSTHESKRG